MSHSFDFRTPQAVSDDEARELLAFAHTLADASRSVIKPYFRTELQPDDKEGRAYYDPVTDADREAETAIRRLINDAYPAHGILGEEHGYEHGKSALTWVLDPIDGTRAFVAGKPTWGTLIALHDGAKPILGIMDQPYTEERYSGVQQLDHAQLDDRNGNHVLATRSHTRLSTARMSSTHPSMFDKPGIKERYAQLQDSVQLDMFGGDCYAYCMVALGTMDLVVEAGLAPYDIQALIPIIEAAGGCVSTWDGGPADLGGKIVASANKELHAEVLAILSDPED